MARFLLKCDVIKQNESELANMWHDQEKWVTCQRFSILSFLHHFLATWKCYILMQTTLWLDIWLQSYEQFIKAENNIKQKNLNTFLADISKTIFPTSDSFPLIMLHNLIFRCSKYYNSMSFVLYCFKQH